VKRSQSDQFNGHPEELLLLYVEKLLDPSRNQWVDDHVKSCADCAENVRRLSEMTRLLRSHGAAFCPEPWELAQMVADGTDPNGRVKKHLAQCARCREELERLTAPEQPDAIPEWFTEAVRREFPGCGGESVSWSAGGFFNELVSKLAGLMSRPTLALGAAAACLLVVVLLSGYPQGDMPATALSKVDWDQPTSTLQHKGGMRLMGPGKTKMKAAVFIHFASRNDAPSQWAVDEMYAQLNPRDALKSHFDILSPHQVAEAVGEESFTTRSAQDLSRLLHSKLGVSLVVTATVRREHDSFTIETKLMDTASHEVVHVHLSDPVPASHLARHIRESIIKALKAHEAS